MGKLELTIKETTNEDLDNVMDLWNDGEVMRFVGFPEGLGITRGEMGPWLSRAIAKPQRCHYSVYERSLGYCGETFYNVDEYGCAALDIKLFPHARGQGIAQRALSFAIEQAFGRGQAEAVYVEPHPQNEKAWRLYHKLGFVSKPRPTHLEKGETYLEIRKGQWAPGEKGHQA